MIGQLRDRYILCSTETTDSFVTVDMNSKNLRLRAHFDLNSASGPESYPLEAIQSGRFVCVCVKCIDQYTWTRPIQSIQLTSSARCMSAQCSQAKEKPLNAAILQIFRLLSWLFVGWKFFL